MILLFSQFGFMLVTRVRLQVQMQLLKRQTAQVQCRFKSPHCHILSRCLFLSTQKVGATRESSCIENFSTSSILARFDENCNDLAKHCFEKNGFYKHCIFFTSIGVQYHLWWAIQTFEHVQRCSRITSDMLWG